MGVDFHAEGQFVFVAPGGLPAEAQTAFADAIEAIVTDGDQEVAKIINKVFGGPQVIKAADLDAVLQKGYNDAAALLKEVEN